MPVLIEQGHCQGRNNTELSTIALEQAPRASVLKHSTVAI